MTPKKTKRPKIEKYFFEDNIRRLFLHDMLRRRKCLKNLTLDDLDSLVRDINCLISNLNCNFKNGKMMVEVSDENNWEGDSLFRDIFLHNVLDIPITCGGSTKDFKEMLEKRWGEKPKQAREMLKELEDE